MTLRTIGLLNVLLFIFVAIFASGPWYYLLLTVAQIIFVPLMLHMVIGDDERLLAKMLPLISVPALISVMLLQVTSSTAWDPVLAGLYFVFTAFVFL